MPEGQQPRVPAGKKRGSPCEHSTEEAETGAGMRVPLQSAPILLSAVRRWTLARMQYGGEGVLRGEGL